MLSRSLPNECFSNVWSTNISVFVSEQHWTSLLKQIWGKVWHDLFFNFPLARRWTQPLFVRFRKIIKNRILLSLLVLRAARKIFLVRAVVGWRHFFILLSFLEQSGFFFFFFFWLPVEHCGHEPQPTTVITGHPHPMVNTNTVTQKFPCWWKDTPKGDGSSSQYGVFCGGMSCGDEPWESVLVSDMCQELIFPQLLIFSRKPETVSWRINHNKVQFLECITRR